MTVARKSRATDRTITADEAEIWNSATRALAPVKGKPRVAPTEAGTRAPNPRGRQAGTAIPATDPHPAGPPAGPYAGPYATPPAELERRQARRIAAGKIAIAARLDLHGYHEGQARARLRTFLFSAHARGELTVLVITGKGATPAAGEPPGERQRGVLRRNVPFWLAEPDLSAIVAGFSEASARHGGAGALYVRLRKPSRRAQDLTEYADR
jgi:DNA-nicking Smr family endonuclease